MEFFASFYKFYNMGKKDRGVKKSHQAKNLKFAIVIDPNMRIKLIDFGSAMKVPGKAEDAIRTRFHFVQN